MVFDGGIGGEELSGEIVLSDGSIGRGESTAVVAEGANPEPGMVVDAAVRVEDGVAGIAEERVIGKERHIVEGHQWSAEEAQRDHHPCRLYRTARPRIPCPPQAVDRLKLTEIHLTRSILLHNTLLFFFAAVFPPFRSATATSSG
ncbi:hypothetical protein SUGI_1041020 [Cryptomeria japonica]|nr:hypothetical protein SUGI_1041020 [Cryptomeria japonica]